MSKERADRLNLPGRLFSFLFIFGVVLSVGSVFSMDLQEQQTLVSVERIWSRAHHNAFTDLVRWKGSFYVTFRESEAHVYANNGAIRVLTSPDGQNWHSVAYFFKKGIDLRDPKLSVTPDGRLMVLMGGAVYRGEENLRTGTLVSFSDAEGPHFSPLKTVQIDPRVKSNFDWLWRVTWHKGKAYGVLYQRKNQGKLYLLVSRDGIRFSKITTWTLPGFPNETSLAFRGDEMIALVRRDGSEDARGFIGRSLPPYQKWSWHKVGIKLGGPALLVLPNGKLLCASRYYRTGFTNRTILGKITPNGDFNRLVILPSGGDCSYPGLFTGDSLLYVSYYSSHEGKTSIYFARLWLDDVLAFTAKDQAPEPFIQTDRAGVLKLACTSPKATIHFTLNGQPPTPQSPMYKGAIHLKKTALLQMLATESKKAPSAVVTTRVGVDKLQPAQRLVGKPVPGLEVQCFQGSVRSANDLIRLKPYRSLVARRVAVLPLCQNLAQFGEIFQGFIRIPKDGLYRFSLRSNDGSRLFVDGTEWINNDGPHTAQEKTGAIPLQAGLHRIEVRYFQAGGSFALNLFWTVPGHDKVEVPSAVFFHLPLKK